MVASHLLKYAMKLDEASQGTFKRSSGKRPLMFDHVALSTNGFTVKHKSARVLCEVDMKNPIDDHTPAAISLTCNVNLGQAPFRVTRPTYNCARHKTQPFKNDYDEAVQKMPTPSPSKAHIENSTVATWIVKGAVLGSCSQMGLRIKQANVRFVLVKWKRHGLARVDRRNVANANGT